VQPIRFGPLQFDGIDNFKQAAIEEIDVFETTTASFLQRRHLAKQTADQIIRARALLRAFKQNFGDDLPRKQADVLSHHSDE